jgi:23S rRNA pseudouridine2605 synthase
VVLMEGRNREVRKLWESQGVRVSRLKRVRYGPVFIPSRIKKGQMYEMKTPELITLYEAAGMTPPLASSMRKVPRKTRGRGY